MRASASIPEWGAAKRNCASPRRWHATVGPRAPRCWRPSDEKGKPMDFALINEQRAWQMTARKFAEEEIRPISLERDEIADPRETFDWEIIKKGSKLGFRTLAVPKEWAGTVPISSRKRW